MFLMRKSHLMIFDTQAPLVMDDPIFTNLS